MIFRAQPFAWLPNKRGITTCVPMFDGPEEIADCFAGSASQPFLELLSDDERCVFLARRKQARNYESVRVGLWRLHFSAAKPAKPNSIIAHASRLTDPRSPQHARHALMAEPMTFRRHRFGNGPERLDFDNPKLELELLASSWSVCDAHVFDSIIRT